MWLPAVPSSSSKVTTSRELCVRAQSTYAGRCALAQLSPAATPQSCMSSQRFGTTKETVGSFVRSVGSAEYGWLTEVGSAGKSAHGTCLRAYRPARQTVEP